MSNLEIEMSEKLPNCCYTVSAEDIRRCFGQDADWDPSPYYLKHGPLERPVIPHRDVDMHIHPKRMWVQKSGYTTVEWMDGTKTTAKAEDPATATTYGGFMACAIKKLYGSTSKAICLMEGALEEAERPKKMKEANRKRIKELNKARHNAIIRKREEKICREMEKIRIQEEARRRFDEEAKKNERG